MHWVVLVYCLLMAGCTVCQNVKRTVWHEPSVFSWKHDRPRSRDVYLRWADQAWAEVSGGCPELRGEADYVLGFRDGFVDYVWGGGNGEPPPVPPRHFWNAMLRSPDGKRRADLWFDGYRHGAAVARNGGYRELGTVRSSLIGLLGAAGDDGYFDGQPPDEDSPPETRGPDADKLPKPPSEPPTPARENTPVEPSPEGVDRQTDAVAPPSAIRPQEWPASAMSPMIIAAAAPRAAADQPSLPMAMTGVASDAARHVSRLEPRPSASRQPTVAPPSRRVATAATATPTQQSPARIALASATVDRTAADNKVTRVQFVTDTMSASDGAESRASGAAAAIAPAACDDSARGRITISVPPQADPAARAQRPTAPSNSSTIKIRTARDGPVQIRSHDPTEVRLMIAP